MPDEPTPSSEVSMVPDEPTALTVSVVPTIEPSSDLHSSASPATDLCMRAAAGQVNHCW